MGSEGKLQSMFGLHRAVKLGLYKTSEGSEVGTTQSLEVGTS